MFFIASTVYTYHLNHPNSFTFIGMQSHEYPCFVEWLIAFSPFFPFYVGSITKSVFTIHIWMVNVNSQCVAIKLFMKKLWTGFSIAGHLYWQCKCSRRTLENCALHQAADFPVHATAALCSNTEGKTLASYFIIKTYEYDEDSHSANQGSLYAYCLLIAFSLAFGIWNGMLNWDCNVLLQ